MAERRTSLRVEELLAERGWLRSLARRLVVDENRADDVEQQVWLQAIERPPAREGSVRGWLRAALNSRWRDQQRSEAARGARERATFEERSTPATADIAARVEAQQAVARAVLDLDEPLRAVVLLHFIEELPLREVARRLDVPYETARHRLGRALEALRRKLRGQFGEERDGRLALLLVGDVASPRPTKSGTRATKTAIGVAGALVVGATIVAALNVGGASSTERAPDSSTRVATAPDATTAGKSAAATAGGSTAASNSPSLTPSAPRATVDVRVSTVAAEPVAGATVEAWALPPQGDAVRIASATSDAQGRVRFKDLDAGRWTFTARAAGHGIASVEGRAVAASETPSKVSIVVGTAAALGGRIVDQDGRAVAGAIVLAEPPRPPTDPGRSALRVAAVADVDGRFALAGLAAGETMIWAALPDGEPSPFVTVIVPDVARFDLTLRRGGTLRGRVTEDSGAPIAGALVRVRGRGVADPVTGSAVTGEDGRYSIGPLLECVVQNVVASKDGYGADAVAGGGAAQPMIALALARDVVAERNILLRRGGRVVGRITGPSGPVRDAAVEAMFADRFGQWAARRTRSDVDGRYVVEHVGPGDSFIRVKAAGLKEAALAGAQSAGFLNLEPFRVDVPERGEASFDVAFDTDAAPPPVEAAPPPGRVRGVVAGEGTRPREAWVEVLATSMGAAFGTARERAFVGADGSFELSAPASQLKSVRVRAGALDRAEAWSAEIAVASLDTTAPVRLDLAPGVGLSGRVRRSGSSAGLAGALVRISAPREDGRFARRPQSWDAPVAAVADAEGRFVVERLAPGTYEVVASAEGCLPAATTVEVPTQDEPVLELESAMEISGRVLFPDDAPLESVHVSAVPEKRGRSSVAVLHASEVATAEDGSFVVRSLAPGRYRLRVDSPWNRDASFLQRAADFVDAGARDVRIDVERAESITGSVLDAAGRPVKSVMVSLEAPPGAAGPPASVLAERDGSFAFRSVRPGVYAVTAQTVAGVGGPGASTARQDGVSAGTSGVHLVLAQALSLEGVLVDADGHPMTGVAAAAAPLGDATSAGQLRYMPADADGRFAIRGLAPGTYEIVVGNMRDRLRLLVVRGAREFAAGATGLRLEVRPGLTATGRLVDEHGAGVAKRVIEFIPDDAVWPRRLARTGADGRFKCDGLGPGRHRAEAVDAGDGDVERRTPCGDFDAGASDLELRAR